MKMKNLFLSLIIMTIFSNCRDHYEKVSIGKNVLIDIPTDFVLEQNSSDNENIFKYKSDKEELYINTQTIGGLDTLSIDRKAEIAKKNINGFAKAVNGENILLESISGKDDFFKRNFSMETKKNNSPMTVFGTVITQNSSFVFLVYITEKSASKASLKAKDKILNSIKID